MPQQVKKRKAYVDRALTSSRDRTSKRGRKTSRKRPDRVLSGTTRTQPTIGMDPKGGHNHPPVRSWWGGRGACPEGCPMRSKEVNKMGSSEDRGQTPEDYAVEPTAPAEDSSSDQTGTDVEVTEKTTETEKTVSESPSEGSSES